MGNNERSWLTERDRELLAIYRKEDPEGAAEYERHLDNERYSNDKFYGRRVRVEDDGVTALHADEDWAIAPFSDETFAQ